MAKIAYGKLKLQKNISTKEIEWNENKIEIKQYLSLPEKLDFITSVIAWIQDDNNFINLAKLDAIFEVHIVLYYAEISFTEKQKEDLWKLYDLMHSSNFSIKIIEAIPKEEIELLQKWCYSIINNYYEYRNSVYGILDTVSKDYENLSLNTEKLVQEISNPENAKLLKDVVTKMS